MRLIHHDDRVAGEETVAFELLKEDAVSHDLYAGALIARVRKAHGVGAVVVLNAELSFYEIAD